MDRYDEFIKEAEQDIADYNEIIRVLYVHLGRDLHEKQRLVLEEQLAQAQNAVRRRTKLRSELLKNKDVKHAG